MGEQKLELLGQLAVQQKLVTADQLKLCLSEQAALRKAGRLVPLGQILVQRRLLTSDQIRRLLLNQKGVPPDAPLLNGKYALVRKLGRGGAGDVYLARDTTLDRPVAVKILREEMSQNKKSVERFLREARVLAKIRHPNVVGVHESGEFQGRPYFVMDYVEGTALETVMTPGAMPLRHKVEILAKVGAAVGELHRHGVVHRDLKPSNVIIDGTGNPMLLDFGLAHDVSRKTKLTVTGTILGTPFYMAPEQVEGKNPDARTDVYALGVLLYEMLTGHLPFRAENEFELYRQISTHEPMHPSAVAGRVPRDLEIICLKAMDKDRQVRYENATELSDDLRRWLEGQPIKARPVPVAMKLWRRVREHRLVASAVGGCLFVGLIVGIVLVVSMSNTSAKAKKELAKAEQAFQSGKLVEAKEAYLRVQALDSDNQTAREGLAKIAEREKLIAAKIKEAGELVLKNPEEAEKIYLSVLDLDVDNWAARTGLKTAKEQKADWVKRQEQSAFLNDVAGWIQKYENDITLPPDEFVKREPMKNLNEMIGKILQRLEDLNDAQRVEAEFLMGRIYMLLGDTKQAQEKFDLAIQAKPKQGRYWYERGRLALSKYRREYANATATARLQDKREVMEKLRQMREQMQKDFQMALGHGVGEGWETLLAQAVVDYTEGRTQKALAACEQVTDHRDAGIRKLLGQIYLDLSWDNIENCRKSEACFESAANIYRSDPEAHSGYADALFQRAQYDHSFALDLGLLDKAAAQYLDAIKLQPSAKLHMARGHVLQVKAEREMIMGRDCTDSILAARDHMGKAVQLEFDNADAHNWLGITYIQGATANVFRTDGQPNIEAAESEIANAIFSINQAIQIKGNDGDYFHNRAVARGVRSLLLMLRGSDAGDDIDRSLADIAEAIRLGNRSSSLYEAKALTHLWKVMYLVSKNKVNEVLPELNESIAACDAAVASRYVADKARVIVFRATIRVVRGFYGFMLGNKEVCVESMRGATQDLRDAVALNRDYEMLAPEAFEAVTKAMELQLDRKDPRAEYAKAREGLSKIIDSKLPKDANAYVLRLSALLLRGFANYHLDLYKEAVADWEELCRFVPPFEYVLSMWLNSARSKAKKQG